MHLLHLRPLFVELPIFVPGGLVLLEPCDLVREQTRRNLRHAAADLRGGVPQVPTGLLTHQVARF